MAWLYRGPGWVALYLENKVHLWYKKQMDYNPIFIGFKAEQGGKRFYVRVDKDTLPYLSLPNLPLIFISASKGALVV